jgi:hypothetical protein
LTKMAECKLCGQTIRWKKDFKSDISGKLIPLQEDPNTDEPHRCEAWKAQHRKYYNCRECQANIYFDDDHISKNGKHIPLNKETGEPHQCD